MAAFASCMIKFLGGECGGGGGGGGSSEGCLKWGGGVIKGSLQNILKQGWGKGKSCSLGNLKVSPPLPLPPPPGKF